MKLLSIEPIEAGLAKPEDYGSKPLVFFDIDGVFNRIPYVERYVGPEADTEGAFPPRESVENSDNWIVERLPFSEELFEDIPASEGGELLHGSWTFPTWISRELISKLRELYDGETADIVFLSLWQEHSRYLNGLIERPIPHVRIPRRFTESERGSKHRALYGFLEEIEDHRGALPPLVWVDDVVTASEWGEPIEDEISRELYVRKIDAPPLHILNTVTAEGITKSQWAAILDFIGTNRA